MEIILKDAAGETWSMETSSAPYEGDVIEIKNVTLLVNRRYWVREHAYAQDSTGLTHTLHLFVEVLDRQ